MVAEGQTTKDFSSRELPPLTKPWQKLILHELAKLEVWQHFILLDAERQLPHARTRERKRWIVTVARLLVQCGKQWYADWRQQVADKIEGETLTVPQFAKWLPKEYQPITERTLRRGVQRGVIPKSCVDRPHGGHYRIRLCSQLIWWLVCQNAMHRATRLCELYPPGTEADPFTPEFLRANADKDVYTRGSDVMNVARAIAMETHSGMNLDEIAKSPHPLWTTPLTELPEKFFNLAAKGRDLEIAQAVGDLVSKHEKPTPEAVAALIGLSRATIYREPCYSYYLKWTAQLACDEPVSKGAIRSKHSGKMKPTADADDDSIDELDRE